MQEANGCKKNVYQIVSKVAYLIGVEKRLFQEGDNLSQEVFAETDLVRDAKVFRSLNIIRTGIMKNYKEINSRISYDLCNLSTLPEYISQDDLQYLNQQGIIIQKPNTRAIEYVLDLTRIINSRVTETVKACFPVWIDHGYLKDIFYVKCSNEKDAKNLTQRFSSRKVFYPYQMYLNFESRENGNILFNDDKFVRLLYERNKDVFLDISKVNDISTEFKEEFLSFMENAGDIYILVDCENTDVYKLYSMMEYLKKNCPSEIFKKIKKMELYDDIHTTSAWKLLHRFTDIKMEHILTERVKEDKSLVDIRLSAGACRAHYRENISDFILVSSDSDYFGLISSLPECSFQMVVERKNVSDYVLDAAAECDAGLCYVDDFCTGSLEPLYADAMKLEIREFLENKTYIDLKRLFSTAAHNARVNMTEAEVDSYCEKYSKEIHMERSGNDLKMTI